MNMFKNKLILNLILVVLLATLGLVSYKGYETYQFYFKNPKKVTLPEFIISLDTLIESLNQERLYVPKKLISHNDSNIKSLQEIRKIVDIRLKSFDLLLHKDNRLLEYRNDIRKVRSELLHYRKNLDNLNTLDKNSSFYFHKNIWNRLYDILHKETIYKKDTNVYNDLKNYETYMNLEEIVFVEGAFVSMVLRGQTPLSIKNIDIWNEWIKKDKLPLLKDFDTNLIEEYMTQKEYTSILKREREMIVSQSKKGKYSVSFENWNYLINHKLVYINKIKQLFLAQIKMYREDFIKVVSIFIAYGILLLFLVILFYKLIIFSLKKNTNQHISEETLRDIAIVFTKNQQKELQRLIANERVDYIYKFLIQAIKDANQTKDLFLASMSHEIRTPLNGILGFTELLKETKDPVEQAEFISVIEKSSENLLTIVNDILDLSKIKAQKIELENIAFDPIDTFEVAIESYAAKASADNIDFNVFLDPTLPTVIMGDPTKISQVIINLISNAIKFTSTNGEVNVRIEKLLENVSDVTIKFSVEDTGIGISELQKSKIFEAFTQADISTSRKYGGTGLGLSISGKFIDVMGGTLSIESIQDEGSTFFFSLVLGKNEHSTVRHVEDMSHITVGILNSHIDTEYYINENVESYLEYMGANIIRYTDETLLHEINLPHILLIDHKFRYRGGEIEKFLDVDCKIIVMSTPDQKRNLKRYKSRINKVIYKPINFTKILNVLSEKEQKIHSDKKVTFHNIHILIAEDNVINQKLILNILERLGIDVSIANNGQEALDMRMEEHFDMIFMDIEMPIMGGMEATGKILLYERNSKQEHIPIIALTANALSGDREKYIGVGMDDYLSKPIKLEALKSLLVEFFEDNITST